MPDITFKRLFEVRILHGYYLDYWLPDAAGNIGIFHEYGASPEDRLNDQAFILENKYDIRRNILIEPTLETRQSLDGLGLRWQKTATGLIVGIEVRKSGSGNDTKFFPKRAVPAGQSWSFLLRSRNAAFFNITNHAMRPTLPGRYYFSNLRASAGEDNKTYPALSVQLPEFSNQRTWEMGELVRDGNAIKAATMTTRSIGDFLEIANLSDDTWHNYAHTGDCSLFPKRFHYRFDTGGTAVSGAEFTLTDASGTEVKKVSAQFTPISPAPAEFPLDFRYLPLSEDTPEDERVQRPRPLPDGWYTLDISINGALVESRRILMQSDVDSGNPVLGLVEISTAETAPLFQLLNADGSLNQSTISGGDPTRWQGPVFEIRMMGRLAYLRYQLTRALSPLPVDPNFTYAPDGRQIRTNTPRRLSFIRTPVSINLPATGDTLLPYPDSTILKYDFDREHYYSEIFLSTF